MVLVLLKIFILILQVILGMLVQLVEGKKKIEPLRNNLRL
jgi:hypothetical protein